MIKDIKEVKNCPECGSMNLSYIESEEQVVCKDCGLVFEPLSTSEEKAFEKAHGIE